MNVFEAVKANVTANDVAAMLGLKPNRSKMICCPFHDDRHPSMKVDERYYCFGCGVKGDAIDFVANYYGIGLKEAAEKIAADFGLPYDNSNYRKSDHHKMKPRLTEAQQWAINKRELFVRLSQLHEHLRQMKIKYASKTEEDSDWSPLFAAQDRQAKPCSHEASFDGRKNMVYEVRNVRVRSRIDISLF